MKFRHWLLHIFIASSLSGLSACGGGGGGSTASTTTPQASGGGAQTCNGLCVKLTSQ